MYVAEKWVDRSAEDLARKVDSQPSTHLQMAVQPLP